MRLAVSISNEAWTNLSDKYSLNNHKNRRPDIAFNGRAFVLIPHNTNARGLSKFLANFLINPNIAVPSTFYYSTSPYTIKPYAFQDMRDFADTDYDQFGYPGQPLDPIIRKLASIPPNAHRDRPLQYTTWTNTQGTNEQQEIRQRILHLPDHQVQAMFTAAQDIVDYWHIALGARLPRSKKEKFSALLNVLGLGYLWIKSSDEPTKNLLPTFNSPAFGVISYRDVGIPDLKHAEPYPAPKPKSPSHKCIFCRHNLATHVFTILSNSIGMGICYDCAMLNTKMLKADSYSLVEAQY